MIRFVLRAVRVWKWAHKIWFVLFMSWVWVNKILTLKATLTIDTIKLVFEILDTTN